MICCFLTSIVASVLTILLDHFLAYFVTSILSVWMFAFLCTSMLTFFLCAPLNSHLHSSKHSYNACLHELLVAHNVAVGLLVLLACTLPSLSGSILTIYMLAFLLLSCNHTALYFLALFCSFLLALLLFVCVYPGFLSSYPAYS